MADGRFQYCELWFPARQGRAWSNNLELRSMAFAGMSLLDSLWKAPLGETLGLVPGGFLTDSGDGFLLASGVNGLAKTGIARQLRRLVGGLPGEVRIAAAEVA